MLSISCGDDIHLTAVDITYVMTSLAIGAVVWIYFVDLVCAHRLGYYNIASSGRFMFRSDLLSILVVR